MGYPIRERAIASRFIYAVVLLALAGAANAAELIGKVVGVSDGDTITVLDDAHQQHKIRLSGIDAPEKRQAFGERSKQNLSDLVYAKNVLVMWDKRDRYGRIIGRVLALRCSSQCIYSVDAGLEQIKAGLAWHYKQYERDQTPEQRSSYSISEQQARARQDGLWRDRDAVAPWDFRHHTALSPALSASISPR